MSEQHEQQIRLLKSLKTRLTIQTTVLIAVAVYFAKDLLLPIVLGMLIALTLSPVRRWMSRRGLPAGIAATILIVGLGSSVGTVGYLMSGPVSTLVADAPSMGRTLQRRMKGVKETVDAVKDASKQVEEITDGAEDFDVQKVVIQQPGLLNTAVDTLANIGATAAVSLVLALFLLASGDLFYTKLVGSFKEFREKKKALKIVYDIERKVSLYLLTITVINAGLGLSIGTTLFFLGLPNAFIWGVLAFLLNFLPYIGMAAGTISVAVFAVASFPSLSYALICPAAYFALTSLEGQFVTPAIVGRRLEINTVSIFLTVVLWGWLWGIAGALMAVPFLVFLKVVCDHVEGFEVLGRFLGARDDSDSELMEPKGSIDT